MNELNARRDALLLDLLRVRIEQVAEAVERAWQCGRIDDAENTDICDVLGDAAIVARTLRGKL